MTDKPFNVGILGLGVAIPDRVMTNHEFEQMVDTTDEWITSRTGIKERRIVAPDQATSDLGTQASRAAIADAGLTPADVDLIICCTFTPDHLCPSTACHIQGKLGCTAAAVDINAACTGFIYGMTMAKSLIETGVFRRVVVVGTEVMSRFVDYTDRNTCVLFGDGAGAVLLGPVEPPRGILSVHLGADGQGADLIVVPAGGSALPASEETVRERKHYIQMAGSEVFKFAVRIMGEAVDAALKKANMTPDQLDLLVPHQANIRIIEAAARRYKLDNGHVMVNVDRYGNTSSASVPLALHEAREQGRLGPGKVVALVAFGGGLTWGASIVRW